MHDELPPHPSEVSAAGFPAAGGVPRRRRPWGWITLLVLVAVGFFAFNFWMSSRRAVNLVNGTASSYTIELDGVTQKLNANSVQRIRLAEGTHTVKLIPMPGNEAAMQVEPGVANLPAVDAEQTFSLTGGMFSRGSGTVFVLNPDRTALIFNRGVGYGSHVNGPDHLLEPQLLHTVSGIDYAFTEAPNSVEVSFGGGKTVRVLEVWETGDLEAQHTALAHEHHPDIANQMVERRFLLGPPTFYLVKTRDRLLGLASDTPSLEVSAPFKSSIPERPKIEIPDRPAGVVSVVGGDAAPAPPSLLDWTAGDLSAQEAAARAAWAAGDDGPLRALLSTRIEAAGPDALSARLRLAVLDRDVEACDALDAELKAAHGDAAVYDALNASFPLPTFLTAAIRMAADPKSRSRVNTRPLRDADDNLVAQTMSWWIHDQKTPKPGDFAGLEASPAVKMLFCAVASRVRTLSKSEQALAATAGRAAAAELDGPPTPWTRLCDDLLNLE